MVWRPSDTFWRAVGTALSGSFTSSQRSAVGGGRSLRADTMRCSTCRETSLPCRETSLHCCCSGRNVPEHYRRAIAPDTELSELFKDVFLYHWTEESQHAIVDELEWVRHDSGLTAEQRERAVDEFIELVAAVDGIVQAQAKADSRYFAANCGRPVDGAEARAIEASFLKAYRWQYIHSGAQHAHFGKVLTNLITENQGQRIQAALATLQ